MTRVQDVTPWRERKPKQDPRSRCCWVCGKPGGLGFTTALRVAGYNVPRDAIGYAHNRCMAKAQQQHRDHATVKGL